MTVPARSTQPMPSADVRFGNADARRCALERIAAARAAGEEVSPLVEAAARSLGVGLRTMWRWMADGLPAESESRAWRPSEDDIEAYVRWKGNAAAAWRQRRAESGELPALRSFQAAIARELGPGDRAVIRDGEPGRRRHQVYLRWEPEHRNELWETDHKQLDVPVLFPRAQRPRQPWSTIFLDAYSRAVMGWAISDQPTSATVLAALGEAIRVDEDRGPFGGLPVAIRPDQGLEFAAEAIEQACGLLVVRLAPAPAYKPNLKGKVERLHLTLVTELLAELPHFTGGPRAASGELWGSGLEALTLDEFVDRFDAWILAYNRQRSHSGLTGQTPEQRWLEDATPLRLVQESELRWTLLAGASRTVRTSGIAFAGLDYVAPELNGLVGESVEVRYRPHDRRSIEVFRSGSHLCTAKPQGTLSDDERAAVLERRRADAAEQARRQRRTTRSARARFAPVTAGDAAQDVTVVTEREACAERAGTGQLHRAARADLLGLPSAGRR